MRGGTGEVIHFHCGGEGDHKVLAEGPRRGLGDEEPLPRREAQLPGNKEGHRAVLGARPQPTRRGTLRGAGEAQGRIRVEITLRRVRIDPEEKRAQYLAQLESMIAELNQLLCNSATIRTTRLKAMETMIKALKCCYTIVRDVDIEVLRRDIEKLKESAKQADLDFAPLDEPQGPG